MTNQLIELETINDQELQTATGGMTAGTALNNVFGYAIPGYGWYKLGCLIKGEDNFGQFIDKKMTEGGMKTNLPLF